jgi:N-acetylneuraminate synthase
MTPVVYIAGKPVGLGHPVIIIAEAGINHNGSLKIAKEFIDIAKKSGADFIKFQMRTIPLVYSQQELDKPRPDTPGWFLKQAMDRGVLPPEIVERLKACETVEINNGEPIYSYSDIRTAEQKYGLEFTREEYEEIDQYCRTAGIMWSASPWDKKSVDRLASFEPPFYKIGSASLTDDELLKYIRSKGKPIILSTGGSTMEQVRHAVEVLGQEDLILLHCVAAYPKEDLSKFGASLNLRCIYTLQNEFPDIPIGYSGNDPTRHPAFAAVAMGAVVVEKHITLERGLTYGSDQGISLEPGSFAELCAWIRGFYHWQGDGVKRVLPEEAEIMKKLRRVS